MSAESCPVCSSNLWCTLPKGEAVFDCGKSNSTPCPNSERLAIERGAEIEKLKADLRESEATECALRESLEVAYNMGKQHPLEELEAIKTALGCQGMSLADTLKVIDTMQTAAIQETLKGEKS